MDERNIPTHGEILFIKEINDLLSEDISSVDGKSVRVTGRLVKYNVEYCTAVVVDPKTNKSLLVNTSLIEPFSSKIGELVQMIGELEVSSGTLKDVSLRARVVRSVDGLDLSLYEQAVLSQREFLKQAGKV